MRRVLALSCRAFPPEHRARQSDEVIDTAALAARGSAVRTAREAFSLVAAGLWERLRAESQRSGRDGIAVLAGLLAIVNLAVALYRVSFAVYPPRPLSIVHGLGAWHSHVDHFPYALDWWWIAFPIAAAGIVLGLALGSRRLALGAALANLGIVSYDAIFLTSRSWGHLWYVFASGLEGDGYPIGKEWLAPAAVLALAVAAAPFRRRSLGRLPLTLSATFLLIVISRAVSGGFFFLRWPVAVLVLLAIMLGAIAPRLAVVGLGVSLALAATVVGYLTTPWWEYKAPLVAWAVAPGFALGIVLPLAYLARRRLT
jgi:hypothetical protein